MLYLKYTKNISNSYLQVIKMGPKKQTKKQVVQQSPKQLQPQIPEHELHGYGKFEYVNAAVYQGSWKMFNGIKMKNGQGVFRVPGNSSNGLGGQIFQGSWHQDKMHGYGTYKYACGAIYKGQWKNNKQHGKGVYQFPNGTAYEGQWKDHLMHGSGFYIDTNGRKWQGEFRNGKFQTKRQKQLLQQKQVQIRKQQSKRSVATTINAMLQALAKSDKKTLKENFSPFFSSGQVIKEQVKQPYSKFDEKAQDKWIDFLTNIKNGKVVVLEKPSSSRFLGEQRVLTRQLQGIGQVVQVIKEADERNSKAAFVNLENNLWILVATFDQQKKK